MIKQISILMMIAGCCLAEDLKIVCPQTLEDWRGLKDGVTCTEPGVFSSNGKSVVMISEKGVTVEPGKTYRVEGDFKLNPYGTWGHIRIGVEIRNDSNRTIKRVYFVESPLKHCDPALGLQLRHFYLHCKGEIPYKGFTWPEGTKTIHVMFSELREPVDMTWSNVSVHEVVKE